MIKAADLMIGNYVNEYILGDVCVNEIYENSVSVLAKHMDINKVVSDIAYTISCSNLIGIPLTPDVLERIDWNGYNKLYLNSYFKIDDVGHLYYCSDFTGINIYYVHQLQNLCKALTGKDLTFKTT